ncbi:MAG: adenylyl-sulfate kinase [Saprospiraceae bacterium]|nr:adenylyl-sulfate kinase [Saprospiraceae bacterium]
MIKPVENIVWHSPTVESSKRESQKNQKAACLWFTGLSGSGKSTIANEVEKRLFENGNHTYLLDGDNIRHGLNKDLGFSEVDRVENIRRIGEVSKLFVDSGLIVLTAFISPFIKDRQLVRSLLDNKQFIEIFVDSDLESCEKRDPKGLYKKARAGEIKNFTGLDSPYEPPQNPELVINNSDGNSLDKNVELIISYLINNKYIVKL